MAYIACLIWNIFVIGGAAYLIGWQGWSGWWLVPAFLAIVWPNDKKD